MGEIRKDYVLDRFVIINADRGKRPDQFRYEHPPTQEQDCPFCPKHRAALTVQERWPLGDDPDGVLLIPNKFPIVKPEGNPVLQTHNTFYTFADSCGEHLVLVEGREHGVSFASLPEEHMAQVLRAYQWVYRSLYGKGVPYVSLFKNEGAPAGASIDHPHSQALSLPVLPHGVLARYEAFLRVSARVAACPYCCVLAREEHSERSVASCPDWVVFCPYASPNPFDTVFFPRRHVPRFLDLTDHEVASLARHLAHVLLKLNGIGAPYNLEVIDGNGTTEYHCHVVVSPRLKKEAGFELETDIIVNPLPPEEAAAFLR